MNSLAGVGRASVTGILFFIATLPGSQARADAFGAPGIPHRWAPALKQAVGTSYETDNGAASPVWFTVSEGILTEVFYPRADLAQVGELQLLVTDGKTFFSAQKRDTDSAVSYSSEGMAVHISTRDREGRYSIEQDIVTDTAAPVVRIRTSFKPRQTGLRLFVLFKPAINNLGSQNLGFTSADGLFATRMPSRGSLSQPEQAFMGEREPGREPRPVHAALVSSTAWTATSAGYVGFSDGWQDLARNFRLTEGARAAGPGNIALTGELQLGPENSDFAFDLALGFGATATEAATYARTSLSVPFEKVRSDYEGGWKGYVQQLLASSLTAGRHFLGDSLLARRSAIVIKMHEDKIRRGAIMASLSKPGLLDDDHAPDGSPGYHAVRPRDLYHAAMGLLAAGDTRTPVDILRYLAKVQRNDGSWPRNFWTDGSETTWRGLPMDQIAAPILLAGHLVHRRLLQLGTPELEMIRKAASFIIAHGPATIQERWEETGGYSPATLAAEIAGLKMAAALTRDPAPAKVAERWQSLLETWTMASSGPLGRNYYLRISPTGNPDDPEPLVLANNGERVFANEILDGGFLELVRLGVRAPHDPRILNTLQVYESPLLDIAQADRSYPGAYAYRRYNRDTYGANGAGGYWPVLAGERGHYSVASGNLDRARAQLSTLERSALSGTLLLPEQTLNAPGPNGADAGPGVACPLVWAHAEQLLLQRSIEERAVFDLPPIDAVAAAPPAAPSPLPFPFPFPSFGQ